MKRIVCSLYLTLGAIAPVIAATAPVAGGDDSIFNAHVQPVFADYCVSCHGAEKSKGHLRLDSFEQVAKGGENGAVFIARDSKRSPLIERMSLPLDEEDHMPPRDKPQPPPDLAKLVAWWIDQGADPKARPSDLKIPPELSTLLVAHETLRPHPRAEVQKTLDAGAVPAVFTVRFVALDAAGLMIASQRASDADVERLRLQIAALEHARVALRIEIIANIAPGPVASEAEAPKPMKIADIMKSIHEGRSSKAVLAPQGKLSDDDLNQMLELYGLMVAMTPPKGDKEHFQQLTQSLMVATKGLLAKSPGADDDFRQAVDCKSCHAQHRAK